MPTWDVWKQRDSKREKPLLFLFSPLGNILPFLKNLEFTFVDGTNEIIPGCMSHRQLPRSLWYRDRHTSETWKPSRSLVKKTPPSNVLVWALLYPKSCSTVHRFYVIFTCLGRATHSRTSRWRLPFHPHTHTCLCSTYPDTTTKIYWIPSKLWIHFCVTCISSPWESLVYRYLKKCVSIREMIGKQDKCNSLSFIFLFSTLHMGTFFRSGLLRS